MAEMSNLQALLGIMNNCMEIVGIAGGGGMLLSSFIPFASGLKGYSSKIAMIALVMIVLGLAVPGVIGWITASAHDANTVDLGLYISLFVSGMVALIMVCASVGAYFLPTIIAQRENKKNKIAISICNCMAFVPLVWLVSFIWACIPEKVAPVFPTE
jgi:hypothetical protein